MPLTEGQRSTLSFLMLADWSTTMGVAHWRGCSTQSAGKTLASLQRKGLVRHSDVSDHWNATRRAEKVLAGEDARYA